MSINSFFEKICFGENGYPITDTEIVEFIESHKENLERLKLDALAFEHMTTSDAMIKDNKLLDKYTIKRDNDGLTFDFEKFYMMECNSWNHFKYMLDKKIKEKQKEDNLTGFKSTLEEPQIESLFNQLKDDFINENTNIEYFKAIFTDKLLPDEFINKKIVWTKTIPLFCCLLFGYSNIRYKNESFSFNGIVDKTTVHFYKKAIQFFSFDGKKVTNKTLSEKATKLLFSNAPQNFDKLYPIIKQY